MMQSAEGGDVERKEDAMVVREAGCADGGGDMRGVGSVVRVVDGEVVDRRHSGLGDWVEGGGR